jgi:hypothetical protein
MEYISPINSAYLHKVKNYTIDIINKYPNIKNLIEDEYYKLLIKIANRELKDNDFSDYYKQTEILITKNLG